MKIKTFLSMAFVFVFMFPLFQPVNAAQSVPMSATITVSTATQLQEAINTAADGTIIELANMTFISPSATGFNMDNLGKRLTLQAASGAAPVISGGSTHSVLHLKNSDYNANKQIIFKGIIFRNGASTTAFQAGGVTIERAQVLFINSSFETSYNTNTGAGPGGVNVNNGSIVFFFNSNLSGNFSNAWGGALAVLNQSKVYIHNSQFNSNRTNASGHSPFSAGGAIFVFDALMRVSNTAFNGNEAGYVGGAIYSYGSWNNATTAPTTDVIVSNCTFKNNKAIPTTGGHIGPTEGGAFHAENQVLAQIYNSRFIQNTSSDGAGVNAYRATVVVENSVFLGNYNDISYTDGGSGGAISVISSDTPTDGTINRPSASLTVRNSWFQGRYGTTATVGRVAGGIGINGDFSRQFGSNGVSQGGNLNTNRAKATIENSVFTDLDVIDKPGIATIAAMGGAITLNMAQLTMSNSMILLSDATSSVVGASGGAIAELVLSDAQLSNVTFARNTADYAGGAIFAQGSNFNLTGGKVLNNALNGGASSRLGSVIFAAPEDGRALNATGNLQNSTISGNTGLLIYDDDRENGPINDMHYSGNSIYSTFASSQVYYNSTGYSWTIPSLNIGTIQRDIGIHTKKALSDNTRLSSEPVTGTIMGVSSKLTTAAPGDVLPTDSYLAYAWSGGSATVDGASVTNGAGYTTANTGTHTLLVGGSPYNATLTSVTAPSLSFYGWNNSVFWNLTGVYLDAAVDYNLKVGAGQHGGVTIPAGLNDVYIYVITKEGGIVSAPPSLPYPPFPNRGYLPTISK